MLKKINKNPLIKFFPYKNPNPYPSINFHRAIAELSKRLNIPLRPAFKAKVRFSQKLRIEVSKNFPIIFQILRFLRQHKKFPNKFIFRNQFLRHFGLIDTPTRPQTLRKQSFLFRVQIEPSRKELMPGGVPRLDQLIFNSCGCTSDRESISCDVYLNDFSRNWLMILP